MRKVNPTNNTEERGGSEKKVVQKRSHKIQVRAKPIRPAPSSPYNPRCSTHDLIREDSDYHHLYFFNFTPSTNHNYHGDVLIAILPHLPPSIRLSCLHYEWVNCSLELLSEHEELGLVVDGQDTGTSDTTENVGTSTLEE